MGRGQRGKPVPSTSGSSYSLEQGSRLGVLSQPLSKPAIAELSDGNHAAHGKQSLMWQSVRITRLVCFGADAVGAGGGGELVKASKGLHAGLFAFLQKSKKKKNNPRTN